MPIPARPRLEGLRLADGALILKVEKAGLAVQVRVTAPGPLLAGGGCACGTTGACACR